MQLIDVMRRLNSEHEIRFLLTAYVETLRGEHVEKRLPPGVATLPLRDVADIEARFRTLLNAELCGLEHRQHDIHGAIANEATAIFGAAFMRLQALRTPPAQEVPVILSAGSDAVPRDQRVPLSALA